MDQSSASSQWFPLSEGQRSRWFLYQLDPACQGRHNNGIALNLRGELDLDAITRALQNLVDRHPMLRACFRERDGQAEQSIVDAVKAPLTVHPACALDDLQAQVERDSLRPFDLRRAPLLHMHLYPRDAQHTVMLLVFDHIVGDGWSFWQMMDELGADLQGQGTATSPPVGFDDFVRHQGEWLGSPAAQRQWDYWRGQLGDELPVLQLHADRAPSLPATYAGATRSLYLPAPLCDGLRALSRTQASSLYVTLLTAYMLVLSKHTGQRDIVVGSSMPGRTDSRWDKVVGDFVNLIAVRCQFDDAMTLGQAQKGVRERALRGMRHQDFPLNMLIERLRPPTRVANAGHSLFQTIFIFQKARAAANVASLWNEQTPGREVDWGLFQASAFPVQRRGGVDFDYVLEVLETDGILRCDFRYNAQMFSAASVERMVGHFETVLQQMVVNEPQSVGWLDLHSSAERAQLAAWADGGAVAVSEERLANQLFEACAETHPDAAAVEYGGVCLSYRELNERSNQVAHRLLALGVKPDQRVALCVGRGISMLVGLMGIWKAGAGYVPLDPATPAARLARMLSDCAPAALLTEDALQDDLPAQSLLPLLVLDADPLLARQPTHNPQVALAPGHLAYVIYTSGSTGEPKGVMVEHRALLNLWQSLERSVFAAEDGTPPVARVALNAAVWFDASLQAILQLLSGRCVALVPNEVRADGAELLAWLKGASIDALDCTPAQLNLLCEAGLLEDPAMRAKTLLIGGEAIDAQRWNQLRAAGVRAYNLYGPTECTVDSTLADLRHAGPTPHIGRPLDNVRIHLLDACGQLAPMGAVGEIHIGGAGLARGYLHRPELTAERFIADPFSAAPNARLYKSGDLARWLADGSLEYLGRNDFQVKLRGYRIELGEIEAKLLQCEGVAEAAVLARADQPGEQRLVAYLRAKQGMLLEPGVLRAQLALVLPDYMLPAAFVSLAQFPLTANGKLNRKALPAPDAAALASRAYQAPEGAAETTVAALWQELLQSACVGRHDDFFELGGHSLLAVQLVARLRQALGVEVALGELFAHPTLAAFALRVEQAGASGMEAIPLADRGAPLPLSWAQQRLWFLDQLDPAAGAAYHMPAGLRLQGQLDLGALRATLDRIVARHESLRTTFLQHASEPVQHIAPADVGFALTEQDLRELDPAAQRAAVDAISAEVFRQPFDLARGPLIRGTLLRVAADEHLLLINQHHIISDGWSLGILVREMNVLYDAFSQGQPDPLAPLALQYADYAQWQRGWLQGAALQAQSDYWKNRLAGAPALLDLPLDRPRPALQSYQGGVVPVALPPALVQSLESLALRHGATLFMTLLAGWGVLLARLSGQSTIVVGTAIANRQQREVEGLIGCFVNTLPLRVDYDAELSVAQLLAQVKGSALDGYAHQDVPFEKMVEALQPVRSRSHSPLFQTMLSLNNATDSSALSLSGLAIEPIAPSVSMTHFDLAWSLRSEGGQLSGLLQFSRDLFDSATVQRFAACFENVLSAMCAGDQQTLGALPLLTAEQRRGTLVNSVGPQLDYSADQLVHRIIEQQAAAHPTRTALVWRDQTLDYAELNLHADALAARLMVAGAVPGARVAICVERGLDMVVGILAVLKTGAAYVPLDPSYPPARLAAMLADSAPAVLLTQPAQYARLALPAQCELVLFNTDGTCLLADAALNSNRPAPAMTGADPAYIIYTSGSTGTSKGVVISHASLQASTAARHAHYQPRQRFLLIPSFAFDSSVAVIFWALTSGAQLIIADADDARDPARLASLAGRHQADLWLSVPSLYDATLACVSPGQLASLRTVVVAGEVLTGAVIEHHHAALGATAALFNEYGPTEATVWCSVAEVTDAASCSGSIGRPIANTQLYVLDARREPVPPGVAGEIYVGGAGVAQGYLDRPALTAERFVADPFSGLPGARLYCTGDLGRWRGDGNLDYLGRTDFQVKLRGYRIELGEIEAALLQCEGVAEAAVLARQDQAGEARLVAYVRSHARATVAPATLRARLAETLPDYMLPAAFMMLDRFPLTPNGKLDRQALPAPDAAALARRPYAAPEGATETAVAALWQELLHVAQVGRDDDFFALGGHSLLAVQVVSRLRQMLDVELPLAELFAQSQLAAFAARVAVAGASQMGAIPLADRAAPLPLSWAQQRLWFLDRLDPAAGAAYRMPAGLRLTGRLEPALLRATLDRIVARHAILRTTFGIHDGEPVQQIAASDVGFSLTEHDLSALPAAARDAAVEAISSEVFAEAFDLARGPLICGRLLRLSDSEHLLLINQHHIISDGWSVGVLVREVNVLYTAFSQGCPDPLAPLALQYVDYALWQRSWLREDALQAHANYWTTRLEGAPVLLDLPLDRARPAQQSYAGASIAFQLSPALSAGLNALARRHGSTLFMTLIAGWGVLMSRLSGQSEVVIGMPVANRQRREVEDLIGFFVNTLALRLSTQGAPSVTDLLAQARTHTLAAYAHQDIPFEQVVEALRPQRSPSHSPLFQTMLTMNDTGLSGALVLPGLTLTPLTQVVHSTHFDLHPTLIEVGEHIEGQLTYCARLFDQATVRRWLTSYQLILASMVEDDCQSVAHLPLLDESQRAALMAVAHGPCVPRAGSALIHTLFEAQAARQPHAVAVVANGRSLSYAELDRRANQLAHTLIGLGIGPDDRVLLCLERSVEMAVGLLGILKAGAAYVPVEPQQAEDRLRHLFADCGARVLLTEVRLAAQLPTAGLRVLALDQDDCAAAPIHAPLLPALTPDHLAYVIYTSGSTGAAKGVMVPHRCAVHFWHAMKESTHRDLASTARVALNASFAFDMSLKGWLQLLSGHPLYLVPAALRADGPALLAFLREHRIDVLDSTPSQLELLLAAGLLAPGGYCPGTVLLGGEAISEATWQRLQQADDVRFFNMYGPTEATVDATIGPIFAGEGGPHIGRPIANAQIYLLDSLGQPVPFGVAGEIHIGGAGVARGYLDRPQLTAERFIADPFRAESDARLYKSGDLGRWLADGSLQYLGRNDFQVKLRGYRIELGEIEAVLRANPQIKDALVLARPDPAGLTRLVAYLVPQPHTGVLITDVRNRAALKLADYMVPSAFVVLESLPLNQNGKLDRQALPEPAATDFVHARYEAPEGEIEVALASIWQNLLGLDQVGRHDDFFDLGGHSLLAVQLISAIRDVLQVDVSLTDLFAGSSLSNLASVVAEARQSTLSALVAVDRHRQLPLSWAQLRLWFLSELDQDASVAYHYNIAIRIVGTLDRAALLPTLDRIVERHEGLRTRFVMADDQLAQVIAPAGAGFALQERDLSALAPAERAAALAAIRADEASVPFDLATGPLLRGQLCYLASDETVLLLTLHHIVTDHWSNQLLVQELNTLYRAFHLGQPDPLPPLAIQYADFAVWQRETLQGPLLEAQADFWRSHLDGAPGLLELPCDRPRAATQSFAGSSVRFTLPASLCGQLRQLSQRHGTTMFMTLLAGWATLLARLSGQSDIVIGTPVANRQSRQVEELIGFFVNTLALRTQLDPHASVAALLAQVRETALAGFSHQDIPFEQVVEALNPPRSLAHSPLFQVLLTLHQSSPADGFEMPGSAWTLIESEHQASHFDLALALTESGQELHAVLDFASDLFDAATVQGWSGQFVRLLTAMVADDTQVVGQLDLLDDAELHQLTRSFNDDGGALPPDGLIHQFFEQQVALAPDAIALIENGVALSYAELNRRANRLAHCLLARGLDPEQRVAVCATRGADLVVAMLGVLKAGGAYVPLDPGHPAERQAQVLADAGARLLLTQSSLRAQLSSTLPLLLLDDPEWAAAQPEHDPALAIDSARLAYVMYTSGSSGVPKGVMICHRNVLHLVLGQTCVEFSPRHRLAYCANPAFDASTWEIWGPLLHGARLVIVTPEVLLEPAAFSALIDSEGITILQLTAGLFKQYADSMAPALQRLEYLLFGGDKSELHTVLKAWRATRPCRLVHTYGPTETTTFTTTCEVGEALLGARTLPIGKPIAHSQLYVLDARMQPVPLGVGGEIYIGGAGVARGYLNRDELTAAHFVADPFSAAPGARLYRTGDVGRWLVDGNLEFMGRNDAQVKLRGYRIELGEIELRLAECPGVDQVLVIADADATGEKRLVAYLTGAPEAAEALRAQLSRHLPDYMLPAAFVTLEALPLTANGKVDRRALPASDAAAVAARVYVAPQGEVELALAAIWQQLLQLERVGRDDQFFELGGHSLIAVQLMGRIREQFEVELPLKQLFARPVLWQLADQVTALRLSLFAAPEVRELEQALATLSHSELLAMLNEGDEK